MLVFRVLWVGHGVEELIIAGEAADTFGRAFAGDFGQPGIEFAGDGISDPADSDFVFPTVAKVIDVVDRLVAGVLDHLPQGSFVGGQVFT